MSPAEDSPPHVVVLVLDDPNRLDEVLEAWHGAGVRGVTIVESTGLHRRRRRTIGARYAYGFPRLFGGTYEGHFTLMTVVPPSQVEVCRVEAERIIGDLDLPNTGMLVAWPAAFAKGIACLPPDGDSRESGAG